MPARHPAGTAGKALSSLGDGEALADYIIPFFAGGLVAYQKVEVTVRRTRPVAGADFNGGNFLLHAEIEHLLIGHIQRAGFDSKLHCHIPSLIRIR